MNKKIPVGLLLAGLPITIMALLSPDHPAKSQVGIAGLKAIPLGFCQITLTGTATNLTIGCAGSIGGGIPSGAQYITMAVESSNARYRDDNVAPTTVVGDLLQSSYTGPPFWYGGTLPNLQFIAVSAAPVLDITFYRITGQ